MTDKIITNIQLGKQKLTENNILTIRNAFNTHKNVKVSVLKSCTQDKKEINLIAKNIIIKLGEKYTYRVLGHSIFIKKWRKTPKKK